MNFIIWAVFFSFCFIALICYFILVRIHTKPKPKRSFFRQFEKVARASDVKELYEVTNEMYIIWSKEGIEKRERENFARVLNYLDYRLDLFLNKYTNTANN